MLMVSLNPLNIGSMIITILLIGANWPVMYGLNPLIIGSMIITDSIAERVSKYLLSKSLNPLIIGSMIITAQ